MIFDAEIINIKNEYVEIYNELNKLYKKQNQLSKFMLNILDNETDVNKRKDIIDFVYADDVEEIHKYALEKIYKIKK